MEGIEILGPIEPQGIFFHTSHLIKVKNYGKFSYMKKMLHAQLKTANGILEKINFRSFIFSSIEPWGPLCTQLDGPVNS